MTYRLVFDHDAEITIWVYSNFNLFPLPVNKAIGIVDADDQLVGGILFQNYNSVNVELSYYGPGTMTLGIARAIARIVLDQFKAARLTVVTSQRNRRLIKSCLKLGFRVEGTQRYFYGHTDNKKNTGVRLVAFKPQLERVAGISNASNGPSRV